MPLRAKYQKFDRRHKKNFERAISENAVNTETYVLSQGRLSLLKAEGGRTRIEHSSTRLLSGSSLRSAKFCLQKPRNSAPRGREFEMPTDLASATVRKPVKTAQKLFIKFEIHCSIQLRYGQNQQTYAYKPKLLFTFRPVEACPIS
jgi:hypothetical protein